MNSIKYCPTCHNILYQNIIKTSSGWEIQYWCDNCKKDTGLWNEHIQYSNNIEPYERKE